MASFPNISRKPTDQWSVKEKLALASAVLRCGDNNWASVSRLIRPIAEPSRPSDWFSQKNAALQYNDLRENLEIPKRKRGERVDNNDTPANLIARKLRIQRIEQLQKLIQEDQQKYREKQEMLVKLEMGELDSELPQLIQQLKEAEKLKQEAEEAHKRWLQEREAKPRRETVPSSPLLTSLLSNANPTLSKLLEMPIVEGEGNQGVAEEVKVKKNEPVPPQPILSPAVVASDITETSPQLPSPNPQPELPSIPLADQDTSEPAAVAEEKPTSEEAKILEVVQPKEEEVATINEAAKSEKPSVEKAPSPQPSPLPSQPTPSPVVEKEELILETSPKKEEVEASPKVDPQVENEESPVTPEVPLTEIKTAPLEDPKPVEEKKAPVEETSNDPTPPPKSPTQESTVQSQSDPTPVATPKPESPIQEEYNLQLEDISLQGDKQEEVPPEEKPAETPKIPSVAVVATTKKGNPCRRRGRPPKVVEVPDLSLVDSVPNSPSFQGEDPELTKEYKTWKKAIMLVWNAAANHRFANTFLHPVTEDVAPGYHQIVLRPMDLGLMKKNIETGVVRTTMEVERDILLMFQNAIMYNSSDHDVYNMSKQMQSEVLKDVQTFKTTQMMLQSSEHKVLRCRKIEEEEGYKSKRSSLSEECGPKKRRARLD